MGFSRLAAFLIALPSPTITSKPSKQPGSSAAAAAAPAAPAAAAPAAGISPASRAVHSRSNARLSPTGVRASLR